MVYPMAENISVNEPGNLAISNLYVYPPHDSKSQYHGMRELLRDTSSQVPLVLTS